MIEPAERATVHFVIAKIKSSVYEKIVVSVARSAGSFILAVSILGLAPRLYAVTRFAGW